MVIRSARARNRASSFMAGHDAIDEAKVQLDRVILVIGSSGDLQKLFIAEIAKNKITTGNTGEHRDIGRSCSSGDLVIATFTNRSAITNSSSKRARWTEMSQVPWSGSWSGRVRCRCREILE